MSRFSNARTRLSQMGQAFTQTRARDPKLVPLVLAAVLVPFVVLLVIGLLVGAPWLFGFFGLLFGVLGGLLVFGRRAQTAAIGQIEGQPGAAAAVLQSMRGPWIVTPAVAFTRKQDFVHRVVGRPGVVLVGEGSPARVTTLLKQEQRRISRVTGEVPVSEVRVGQGEGAVPLGKLQGHMTKLPRAIKPKEVGPLDTRLSALGDAKLPMPKGPMPKAPRGKRRLG